MGALYRHSIIGAGNLEHFGRDIPRHTPRDTVRAYGGKNPLPASHKGLPGENSPSSYTTTPPMTTSRGETAGSPSNGVQPHLLWRWSGSTGAAPFGYTAKSPRSPAENPAEVIPSREAGFIDVFLITSCRLIFLFRTSAMRSGTRVSTPGIPDGAAAKGCSFSERVCGAWSEAMASIRSHTLQRSLRSFSVLIGGFTLQNAAGVRGCSRERNRWCGVTSTLPVAASTADFVLIWQKCSLQPAVLQLRTAPMARSSPAAGLALSWETRLSSAEGTISSAWMVARAPRWLISPSALVSSCGVIASP